MTEIKITGITPLETLASVIAFRMHCVKNQEVHAAATHMLEVEESKMPKSDTVLTAPMTFATPTASVPINPTPAPVAPVDPAPVLVVAVPAAGPQVMPPGNAPAVTPVAAAPVYTVGQIGKAGVDLVSQDAAKMSGLPALPQKYGAQVITQLEPEQLDAFATELRGLGTKL